ncbi:MAG: phosphotransferase family protein [Mycobacterium sp.]|uniref:phosphotransferase family protein n=1 Tax=Mycobacterium sp. TaxID=1785 RepID=UPI003CC643FF
MTDTRQLSRALTPVVTAALGNDAAIDNLRALTGGASRSTWAFDAVTGDQRHALILRIGPPDDVHAGMELEARVQAAAAAAGAPVPRILVADNSAAALGNPFLICDEIKGETIVRRIDRRLDDEDRPRLLRQCAQALAAINSADARDADLQAQDQLGQWRDRLDTMADTTATFEWVFRWLAAHRPVPSPQLLVHGDFRMGNLIVDGAQLAAVLDWELVHVGEAYEDLAWFCIRAWRFGAPVDRGAGGLGSVEDFLSAYEGAAGVRVDRASFHWWLILATLRWGVICRYQAERHLSGQTRSVELAAIGRRVCETEWDLLNLIERIPPGDDAGRVPAPPGDNAGRAAAPPGDNAGRGAARGGAGLFAGGGAGQFAGGAGQSDPTGLYGRPSAAELVVAVAEFLERDVRESTVGQVNFHARVAANVLRIVERELLGDAGIEVADVLAGLGFADEAQLAAAIRRGALDDRADDVTHCLRALVSHRLGVAHPGYQHE